MRRRRWGNFFLLSLRDSRLSRGGCSPEVVAPTRSVRLRPRPNPLFCLSFRVVTGIIADALERRHDVIVCSSPMGRMSKACIDVVPCILTTHKVPVHPHGTFATGASRIVGGARETDGRKLARTERKQTQKLVFAGEGEASWRYRGL